MNDTNRYILDQMDLEFINKDEASDLMLNLNDAYVVGTKRVPRVTRIINSYNTNLNGLLSWANGLGWKRQSYNTYMNDVSTLGTFIHTLCEGYVKEGKMPEYSEFAEPYFIQRADNAFQGFKSFWDVFKANHNIVDIRIEEHVITPYYGGTMDMWVKEKDGTETIYDFKSSNNIQSHHFLQLAGYKLALESFSSEPHFIRKVAILKLDKNKPHCNEYVIDTAIETNRLFMDYCRDCFISMLYTYYNAARVDEAFKIVVPRRK